METEERIARDLAPYMVDGEVTKLDELYAKYTNQLFELFDQCILNEEYYYVSEMVGHLEWLIVEQHMQSNGWHRNPLGTVPRWEKDPGCDEAAADEDVVMAQSDLIALGLLAGDPNTDPAVRTIARAVLDDQLPRIGTEPPSEEEMARFMDKVDAELERRRRS